MRIDLSLSCDEDAHSGRIAFAILCTFVFVVGIPLWWGRAMWPHRGSLRRQSARKAAADEVRHLEFLWGAYQAKCWWYELFAAAYRAVSTAVIVSTSARRKASVYAAVVFEASALAFDARMQPFQEAVDNVLQIFVRLEVIIVLLATFFLADDDGGGNLGGGSLSLLIILTHAALLAAFVALVCGAEQWLDRMTTVRRWRAPAARVSPGTTSLLSTGTLVFDESFRTGIQGGDSCVGDHSAQLSHRPCHKCLPAPSQADWAWFRR